MKQSASGGRTTASNLRALVRASQQQEDGQC